MTPTPEIVELENTLHRGGVRELLSWLNRRTPHRFTGIYRYDGDILRNLYLFDRSDPTVQSGGDELTIATWCALLREQGHSLEVPDGTKETRFPLLPVTSVISYCGALIRDENGEPYGTLCHYDMLPCEQRISDIPLLEAATPLIYQRVRAR